MTTVRDLLRRSGVRAEALLEMGVGEALELLRWREYVGRGRAAREHGGGELNPERLARAWHEANQQRQIETAERNRMAGRLITGGGLVPLRPIPWEQLPSVARWELLEQARRTAERYEALEPRVSFEDLQAWCARMAAVGGRQPRLDVDDTVGARIELEEGPPALVRMSSQTVQELWAWLDRYGMAPADPLAAWRGAARPDGGGN